MGIDFFNLLKISTITFVIAHYNKNALFWEEKNKKMVFGGVKKFIIYIIASGSVEAESFGRGNFPTLNKKLDN